jgi:regulator of protease activity HflC (stomatin/prohibitin superfamily)
MMPPLELDALVAEAARSGLAGIAIAAFLMVLAVVVARALARDPGAFSRAQEAIVPVLGFAAALSAWLLLPAPPAYPPSADLTYTLAGLAALGAFLCLIVERRYAGRAEAARRLAFVAVAALLAGAAAEIGRGFGARWFDTVLRLDGILVALVSLELALRALGRWFLPPAPREAAASSLLALVITGLLGGGGLAAPLRREFGLDFSRSFALRYARAALAPAVLLTLLAGWAVTGIRLIPLDQRGIDERLGAPVAVWQPGLHLGLPWPFGRVRLVENGMVHELPLGGDAAAEEAIATPAENLPPPSADRLWGVAHPAEGDYLIASPGLDAPGLAVGRGTPGFQVISADLRVLWRIGLSDADARAAAYAVEEPALLLRELAGHQLTRVLAGRTLEQLLDERQEALAGALTDALRQAMASNGGGIEVISVVIEAVHPPAGAAAAYRAVQAAAIEARTTVAREQGQAEGTVSFARQEAAHLRALAAGTAASSLGAARIDAINFAAERQAYAAAGKLFLFETYLRRLAVLRTVPLTLLDPGLRGTEGPVVDLRPPPAAAPVPPEDPD